MKDQRVKPWLGRQDSNLGMAESKSSRIANAPNEFSEIEPKSGPSKVNSLAAVSECGRTETGTAATEHDYADDLDNEGYEDNDGWLDQECALGNDGQCGLAGTEHCDFECPYRDSEDFAGSEAWRKKHAARSPAPPFAGCSR